jgi:hypothetical protein
LTYKGTTTSFYPVKLRKKHPTCKILMDMVCERLNVYDKASISVNDPVEVAIILNE